MADEPRYWYAAKLYGWGYRWPLTWEGWFVDIALFVSFIGISPYVRELVHPFKSLVLVFGLLVLYLAIGHWKGEPNNLDD